jgi:hypothetical protein
MKASIYIYINNMLYNIDFQFIIIFQMAIFDI